MKETLNHAQQRPMDHTTDSIIKTPEGLFFSDTFLQAFLDRVEHLSITGREEDSKALFAEFDLPARP